MELDPVVESFEANVTDFLAGIEAAIEATRNFRDEILELQAALDSLPLERTVTIRYDTQGAPEAFAAGAAAGAGAPDTAAARDAFAILDDALAEYEAMSARAGEEAEASAIAFGVQAEAMHAAGDAAAEAAADDLLLADAERQLAEASLVVDAANLAALKSSLALQKETQAASAAAGAGGGGGGGFWGFLGRDIPMMAGLLPAIKGWHIALDAVFESAIAVGTALAALTAGLAAMVPAAEDIYTHLTSVQAVNAALKDQIPVLGGDFRNFAESAGNASHVLEIYGGLINAVSGQTGIFAGVAKEVVAGLDDWVAKLDLWMQGQSNTGKLLQDGVGFLHQFEQAVDNVAIAISHLLAADPGTAHYLMDLVVAGTKFLDVITELPAPVLEAALALHSFWLWGGLLGTGIANLLTPLRAMALGMGDVKDADIALTAAAEKTGGLTALKATIADIGAGFATWGRNIGTAVSDAEGLGKVGAGLGATFSFVNPVALGIAALAAGVGYLTYEMMQSSQASQQFAQTVNQAFTSGGATSFLTQVPTLAAQGMSGLTASINQQTDAWKSYNIAAHATVEDIEHGNVPAMLESGAKAVGDFFEAAIHGQQAQNSIDNYTGALAKLSTGTGNLLHDLDPLVQKGYSVSQSFALMDLAGVQASDSFALAQQKVQNLITGYEAMSVKGNLLAGAVNAVTFASEQQDSKVQALTQAYSTWFSTISGGESTFNSFAQQAIGLYQSLDSSGLKVTDTNGKVSSSLQLLASGADGGTASMTGLNSASLNAQNTFLQSASAAQSNFNSLLTLSSAAGLGAKGTQMLTGAMNDYMATLIPGAANNKAFQQILVSMYQEVNPNVKSFGQLGTVVGNIKNPIQSLQNVTTAFTVAAGNLTQDVQNLAQAIGQNLNQAMAAAILQANGGQQAFDQFATAMLSGKTNTQQMHDAALQLAEKLITVTGNTQTAEGEFVTFATQMGLSKTAAEQLWDSVEKGAANADAAVAKHAADIAKSLNGIPKLINIGVDFTTGGSAAAAGSGLVNPSSGTVYKTGGHTAQGGYITGGIEGQDSVPIMAMPGEVVVPTAMVDAGAVDHLRGKIPGFAAGGRVGSMADVFALWGREMAANDLRGHGAGHPLSQKAMEALLASVTQPKKLSGIWDNPQWRDYAKDLKADLGPYSSKDLEYWGALAGEKSLGKSEKAAIAHDLHEMHLHSLKHQPGWVTYYEKQMHSLEAADAKRMAIYAMELAALKHEGFAAGGLVRSYDSGGYLPVGLSMAYNGTGRAEPVGAAAKSEVHVHLHGDLADDAIWSRMQAQTFDYNFANTGSPTGVWQPGG